MGNTGLTGIAALEAEMRDMLADRQKTIDRLTARVAELERIALAAEKMAEALKGAEDSLSFAVRELPHAVPDDDIETIGRRLNKVRAALAEFRGRE